jgi:hypothetical protein
MESTKTRRVWSALSSEGEDMREAWQFTFDGDQKALEDIKGVAIDKNNSTPNLYQVVFPTLVHRSEAEEWVRSQGGVLAETPDALTELFGPH